MLLESAFHLVFSLTFLFILVTFSKSYTRKQKWLFFKTVDNMGSDCKMHLTKKRTCMEYVMCLDARKVGLVFL